MSEAEAPAPEIPLGDHGEMSFEDAMRAATGQEPAPQPTEAAEEPAEGVQDETRQEAAPETPETPEAVETPPEEAPAQDRSLARIMEKEAALEAKQAAYDSSQAELDDLRSRLDRFEGTQAAFSQDPISFIKAVAPEIDLKRLAEGLWNEQLGEKAPPEYRQEKAASQHNRELAERMAKMEQAEQARQQSAQQQEAQRGLNQYLGALTTAAQSADPATLPLVAAMQEKHPQDVAVEMENIARAHARQTNGQVLSPEQVAQAYEQRLAKYQLTAAPAKEPPPPAAQGTSLRNSSTQVQPDRAAADEMSDDYLHEQAMKAVNALRE